MLSSIPHQSTFRFPLCLDRRRKSRNEKGRAMRRDCGHRFNLLALVNLLALERPMVITIRLPAFLVLRCIPGSVLCARLCV